MLSRYYTIGMAGHIDHGKTTLTKALTSVDTDRLKEEKERNITIELGFAPFDLGEGIVASIVDVPGHEKFIRQMIAGVAGIDLVILVVAADEGVMPQTREHLEILSFLGIKKGIVAVSKIDRVDDEMREIALLDIKEELIDTPYENAEMVFVNSIEGDGIPELREKIISLLPDVPNRNITAPFRMPIDQVFTIQGKGTIARGTIFEGSIEESEILYIEPNHDEVRARSIQVHNQKVQKVFAGQRAAINVTGISLDKIKRGDVLTSSSLINSTKTIDIVLQAVKNLKHTLKQRENIKINIGTNEVMGKIIFFDRNDLLEKQSEQILCQIRLEEPVAVMRGDKLIIRRPSPAQTVGGGWVIDPNGEKYRFGKETVTRLFNKMKGTPEDRIIQILEAEIELSEQAIAEKVGIASSEVNTVLHTLLEKDALMKTGNLYVLTNVFQVTLEKLTDTIVAFHKNNSLKVGINKAELLQSFRSRFSSSFLDNLLSYAYTNNIFKQVNQFIALDRFTPTYPDQWKKRMENVLIDIKKDELRVKSFEQYLNNQGIPSTYMNDLKHFFTFSEKTISLDDEHLIHWDIFIQYVHTLYNHTKHSNSFKLNEAKEALGLPRKFLILFLEMLDSKKITKRHDMEREWIDDVTTKYQ
jgi:selenocysteine-specific elongation factor